MTERFRRGPARGASSQTPVRPFYGVALTLLVPAVALVGYFGYRFLSERTAQTPPEAKPVSAVVTASVKGKPPARPQPRAKRIVLILDDIGYDVAALDALTTLDPAINFAILPNAPHSAAAARRLSARGFELLCHLPMEPVGYPGISPGEGAILTSMSDEEIRNTTEQSLRLVPNCAGVNNHMGSRATEDPRVMKQILAVIREEGRYFVDSRTTAGSVGASLARSMKIPTASRDIFLDADPNEASIRKQLRSLAESAERSGVAVGIGHLYPETIKVLREEVPRLRERGFRFIRASEAAR